MNKPSIIVHMMTPVDGRIDCEMTAQLAGEPEYYSTLDSLNVPTRISGRVTAETELTRGGKFNSQNKEILGKTDLLKMQLLIIIISLLILKELYNGARKMVITSLTSLLRVNKLRKITLIGKIFHGSQLGKIKSTWLKRWKSLPTN